MERPAPIEISAERIELVVEAFPLLKVRPMESNDELIHAERSRAEALITRDAVALARWLHPTLIYVHANGLRHDLHQLLQFVESGPRFLSVELRDSHSQQHGDVGLLHGELHLQLKRPGDDTVIEARSFVTEVWLREAVASGPRWKLARFQSTRRAES